MTKPITLPQEVKSAMPDEIVEVFNDLIQRYWDGRQARFKQEEAVGLIATKLSIRPNSVFDKHYLDVEELYRQAGWKVVYDKPGFNENPYPPTFTFSKKEG